MSKYIPVYMHPDRMPVDISFVFEDERPAGKHGFCTIKGENMYFEDGTLAKFWGVMMNGAACFRPMTGLRLWPSGWPMPASISFASIRWTMSG